MKKILTSCLLSGIFLMSSPLMAADSAKAEPAKTEAKAESAKTEAAASPEFTAALKTAKAAKKAAAAVGGEWRDIGKFLKKAEAAEAKGDSKKAMKLVAKAQKQAELGKAQAEAEQATPRYPKF